MIVLGVTGSIGMGKTTAAAALRRLGVPVFEADACVHALLAKGGAAVPLVAEAFPSVVHVGMVDRLALGRIVFANEAAREKLELIIHPLVRRAETRFLTAARSHRARIAALDLPLLFETGAERLCNATLTVSAPRFLQEARVLSRPGMTRAKLEAILASQLPDHEKRRRADFVLPTGTGLRPTLNHLRRIIRLMRRKGRSIARNRPRY
ncbi:MAG: dephospho-CoA kinase [Alphaproteobacteria bacterium]